MYFVTAGGVEVLEPAGEAGVTRVMARLGDGEVVEVKDLVGWACPSDLGMEPIEISENLASFYKTPPAKFTLRPHVGLDFVMLGIFAVGVQLDVAVMKHDEIALYEDDVAATEASFNSDELGGLLTSEAGGEANLAAAMVGTGAFRFQF